jgi:hypothetical protein
MTSKRTLLQQERRDPITQEMLRLFRRGRQLQLLGADDIDAKGAESDEFRALDKKLNWTLLHRVGQCSVFDNFDGDEPQYMARRSDAAHPDLCGWHSGKELQRRLEAALASSAA